MSQKAQKAKFRPVLTLEQIQHTIKLAKLESPISDASINLIATLTPYIAKIEAQSIAAAYTTKERQNLESKLGFTSTEIAEITGNSEHIAAAMNKEEYWKACYLKYSANPTVCTTSEILAAQEHMYLNDLMSPEEMVEFEKKTLDSIGD